MITTIEVYTISFRHKRAKEAISFADDPDIFDMMTNDGHSLLKYIDTSLTGDLPAEKMSLRIPRGMGFCHPVQRYICGILETGHYGKVYEAVDKDDPKDEEKKIILGKSKAIMKPFFFYLKIPRKGRKALLILERTEGDGIYPVMRSVLISYLNKYMNIGVEEEEQVYYTIDKYNFVPDSYIKRLQEGKPKTYTMTANTLPPDICEQYFGDLDKTKFSVEFVIKFGNDMNAKTEKKIREKIKRGEVLFDSPELNDIFEGSTKKVTSTVGEGKTAKTRTVYLDEKQQNLIRPYYEIEVEENEKGFSDFESIKKAVVSFVHDTPNFKVLQ